MHKETKEESFHRKATEQPHDLQDIQSKKAKKDCRDNCMHCGEHCIFLKNKEEELK